MAFCPNISYVCIRTCVNSPLNVCHYSLVHLVFGIFSKKSFISWPQNLMLFCLELVFDLNLQKKTSAILLHFKILIWHCLVLKTYAAEFKVLILAMTTALSLREVKLLTQTVQHCFYFFFPLETVTFGKKQQVQLPIWRHNI